MTERLNRMEGERTTASRKAELEGIISRLPENQRMGYQRLRTPKASTLAKIRDGIQYVAKDIATGHLIDKPVLQYV